MRLPRDAWPRVAPFALFIALMAAEPVLAPALEGIVDARWLYALRSVLAALLLVVLWRRYTELKRPRVTGAAWLEGVGVGVVVFVLWIGLDFPPLVLGEAHPYIPMVDGRLHGGLALTRLAGAALVVPVVEELFWRSFLMRWLEKPGFLAVDPRTVGSRAILISSVVFALEHRLWLAGFLAGLAYGALYRRTGSLWVVIVAHAVTNGVLGVYVLGTHSWHFW
jgi:CAAX prenyl protease-like protein